MIKFTQSDQVAELLDVIHVERKLLTDAFQVAAETAEMAGQKEGLDKTQLLAALAIVSDPEELKGHELRRELNKSIILADQRTRKELAEIRNANQLMMSAMAQMLRFTGHAPVRVHPTVVVGPRRRRRLR